jgi:hypothetical protein
MQTEYHGGVNERDFVHCVKETLECSYFGLTVVEFFGLGERELTVLVKQKVSHVLLQVGSHHPPVPVISDPPAVHSLTNEVLEGVPGDRFLFVVVGFGEVHVEQPLRDREIALVEIIADIPSNFAILSPVLDDDVEKANHINERLEGLMRALVQRLLGQFGKGGLHVEAQAVGGAPSQL